ncbi:HIT domain-containing protein [Candidatus Woesearchaeota archaeon]|nr:HIT domain-containing protein [Candidatus Woesearchaeota archaeon]
MQFTPEQQQALEAQKANCPFCKIIKGEIPSKKIYEDDKIIAVLDINPAFKGHTLVMPKEHYPILPLLPQETFQHLAVKIKEISKAVKEGVLVFGDMIFVANGVVAGQQSQHFLLHIIPREKNDDIDVFELKKGEIDAVKEEELYKVLKNNLPLMLKTTYAKFPLQQQQQKTSSLPPTSYAKEEVLAIIDKNIPLKRLIVENSEQFKALAQTNPQLQMLLKNVVLDEIIAIIQKKEVKDVQKQSKPIIKEAEIVQEQQQSQFSQSPIQPSIISQKPAQMDVFKELEENFKKKQLSEQEAEEKVYEDFMEVLAINPKLKYLLLYDMPLLKEKIAKIAELQDIFKDVDLAKLKEYVEKKEAEDNNQKNNENNDTATNDDENNLISRIG